MIMANRVREVADTPQKGQIRHDLYKSVIDRYLEAMRAGYYLEAITLMESLISDRLESALNYYQLCQFSIGFRPLGDNLRSFFNQGIISDELYAEIDNWRKDRNQSLHEMAKIEFGTAPTFSHRYALQKTIAEAGYNIFKKLKEELR